MFKVADYAVLSVGTFPRFAVVTTHIASTFVFSEKNCHVLLIVNEVYFRFFENSSYLVRVFKYGHCIAYDAFSDEQ